VEGRNKTDDKLQTVSARVTKGHILRCFRGKTHMENTYSKPKMPSLALTAAFYTFLHQVTLEKGKSVEETTPPVLHKYVISYNSTLF
jgi:hypothetical protein